MKQNITLAVDRTLLKRARALAAQRGKSISGLLAEELEKLVNNHREWERAKARALSLMDSGFHLGGGPLPSREELHERKGLRRFQHSDLCPRCRFRLQARSGETMCRAALE